MRRLALTTVILVLGILTTLATSHADIELEPVTIFGARDLPVRDGIPDELHSAELGGSSFIGQVTGPGPPDSVSTVFTEEAFIEYDLRNATVQQASQAILSLRVFYSDFDFGTGKAISISVYEGTGIANLDAFGTGSLLGSFSLPPIPNPGAEYLLAVDVTEAYNNFTAEGIDFLGLRIHGAAFAPDHPYFGINTAQVALGSGHFGGVMPQVIEVTPIPECGSLIVWSLLGTLAAVGWWRRRKLSVRTQGA